MSGQLSTKSRVQSGQEYRIMIRYTGWIDDKMFTGEADSIGVRVTLQDGTKINVLITEEGKLILDH